CARDPYSSWSPYYNGLDSW
nr:immunoglobulin heavy chain junction region [Macaca mulatta]MOY22951.1 immunoglobulin heavy chain junction region [Macaca mulatta]MOY24385.1 immunoglobulin heavy chain junction region [Macaca mulatta]MOY25157.1 immunoglobulin heavy chain junction region [Macaca mulatta]MOY25268.1 immunoglobulin heavy chain junction region [Macaca mulatta]